VTLNAADETGDLYSAIDGAMSKIERQVKKHESKRQSRKYETAPATRREARAERPKIEMERIVIKPMSVEEAAMELDSTKAEFLLFENTDSDLLNVLYRSKGGKYRVLEPEVE
jgi:putative sigma-54 modulation protein